MSDVYELATIADLLKIPTDKLGECLRDIEYAISLCHFAGGDEAVKMSFDSFTWTDDGKHIVNMALNGEPFLDLDVTDRETELDATAAPVVVGEDQLELMTCAAYDAWIDAVQSDEPPTNFGAIQIAVRAALTAALAGDR